MKKYIILGIIAIMILSCFLIVYGDDVKTTVNLDGENVSSSSIAIPFSHNTKNMDNEITNYALESMIDPNSNITSLKNGIYNICKSYGYNDITLNIKSQFGENTVPIIFQVEGNSMVPTLQNGQSIVVEKTKNISVGDIVVANDTQYGVIVKRVANITNNQVYLISDNKNIEIKYINGQPYEVKGITTWTNLSNIFGIVKIY